MLSCISSIAKRSGERRLFTIGPREGGELRRRVAWIEVLDVERRHRELVLRGAVVTSRASPPRPATSSSVDLELEVPEAVVDDGDRPAPVNPSPTLTGGVGRSDVVEDHPLGIEVVRPDDDASAPVPDAAHAVVAEHRDLAEVVSRADGDGVVDLHEHALEALVEVDAVLGGSNTPLVSTSPVESSSITSVGGTRPPSPMTVAGIAGTAPAETTVGVTISVIVRLSKPLAVGGQDGKQPARNSWTRPLTRTVGCPARLQSCTEDEDALVRAQVGVRLWSLACRSRGRGDSGDDARHSGRRGWPSYGERWALTLDVVDTDVRPVVLKRNA